MFPDAIVKGIPNLVESTNTLSGAIHQSVGCLETPIKNLSTTFETSSKKTEELSNKLVFWTKIMAFAIIGQIIAGVVQIIVAISLANSS